MNVRREVQTTSVPRTLTVTDGSTGIHLRNSSSLIWPTSPRQLDEADDDDDVDDAAEDEDDDDESAAEAAPSLDSVRDTQR